MARKPHGRKILEWVVTHVHAQCRRIHHAARGGAQQRIPVGRGFGCDGGAHRGACAGAVIDDHGLTQCSADAIGQCAGRAIRARAGRIGHDQTNRLGGVRLLLGENDKRRRSKQNRRQECQQRTQTRPSYFNGVGE